MKVSTTSQQDADLSPALRRDIGQLRDGINNLQRVLDMERRSDDPASPGSGGNIKLWYRSDLQQLRFWDNGTKYKIQAAIV